MDRRDLLHKATEFDKDNLLGFAQGEDYISVKYVEEYIDELESRIISIIDPLQKLRDDVY